MFEISDLRRREIRLSVCPPVGGGGGWRGTLIFSYIRRLWLFWGVQNIEFQYIFRGFQKILWIFLGGHHKIELYLEVISMHFRVFSEGQGTEWRIFFGLLKLQISIWGA